MNTDSLPQQKVLIVDDDQVSRLALAQILEGECRVMLAKDGASALQRVAADPDIDLILLDVSMPGISGFEVLRQLRAAPQTAAIPVIFVTALSGEKDEEQGLSLGALDYLFKPVRPAIVRARVRLHLKLIAQRRELERLAGRDSLTGIANRRGFEEALEFACRLGGPLGVALIDVDCFGEYNGHYGHGAGDECLRRVAQVVDGHARRPRELAARYGGEEFALLLAGADRCEGLLDRLRLDIQALGLPHAASSVAATVSVSIGAVVAGGTGLPDPATLLRQADAMLSQAKRQGRNRVVAVQV